MIVGLVIVLLLGLSFFAVSMRSYGDILNRCISPSIGLVGTFFLLYVPPLAIIGWMLLLWSGLLLLLRRCRPHVTTSDGYLSRLGSRWVVDNNHLRRRF